MVIDFRRDTYWLKNASIPSCLIANKTMVPQTRQGLCWCDLEITGGIITQILPAGDQTPAGIDLQRGIVFPCFTDIHTHLDKGHIWERTPNPSGTFQGAIATVERDVQY